MPARRFSPRLIRAAIERLADRVRSRFPRTFQSPRKIGREACWAPWGVTATG